MSECNICNICNSNNVEILEDNELITYKGNKLEIMVEYSVCSDCGREFLSKNQIVKNEVRVRDKKKSSDGLLTSKEVYDARIKLSLTQEQASIVFGGGKNAFSKYERGEVSQSSSMDKLIRLCLKHPYVFKELLAACEVGKKEVNFIYEKNVLSYGHFKAANQEKYKSRKTIQMREVAYG